MDSQIGSNHPELDKAIALLETQVPWKVTIDNFSSAIKYLIAEIDNLMLVIDNLNNDIEKLEDDVEMVREEESYL